MKLEWDDAKCKQTLRERGIDFADCAKVFDGPTYSFSDSRKDYGEERVCTVGVLEGRLLIIVSTERGDTIRIISVRRANEREEKEYAAFLGIPKGRRRTGID